MPIGPTLREETRYLISKELSQEERSILNFDMSFFGAPVPMYYSAYITLMGGGYDASPCVAQSRQNELTHGRQANFTGLGTVEAATNYEWIFMSQYMD